MRVGVASGALACLLGVSACAPSIENASIGRFTAIGFYNRVLPYRVVYEDASSQSVVGGGFRLDNFWSVELGHNHRKLEAMNGEPVRYEAVLLDAGESLFERRVHAQDLIYVRPATRSSIWLSSAPLRSDLGSAKLFDVASQHLQAILERGFPTVGLGASGLAPRYRARVLEQRDVRVDGLKAFETTVELSAANGRGDTMILRSIVVRPAFTWRIDTRGYPTLLILGYAGPPAHFAAGLPVFERFVNRVEIDLDGALRDKTREVLACAQPQSDTAEVGLEIDARGAITSLAPIAPWRGTSDPTRYESDEALAAQKKRIAAARTCLQQALRGVRVAATGEARDLRFVFERGARAAQRVEEAYRAGPWPPPPAPAPSPPGGEPPSVVPPAPSPSAPSPEADAAVRAALERHHAELLACVGAQLAAVQVDYAAGAVQVELRDALRGGPEEACVRHVLGDLEAPPGTGRVIHVLSSGPVK